MIENQPEMARPKIPIRQPHRRSNPVIPDPMPRRLPKPDFVPQTPREKPIEIPIEPRKPVPVGIGFNE